MTDALRHRDFRLLWLGHSVSSVGDRLIVVALALFVIDLTGSASDVGYVLAAHILPLVAFVLLGGVWADRLPRRGLMIVSDLLRFVLAGTIAVLIFTEVVEVWHLVVLLALDGIATAFFRPAFHGLLPQTVPEEDIQSANALAGLSNNLAEFAGPALATALVLGIGAGWAFALDAATFLASAVCLTGVRARPRGEPMAPASFVADLREGYAAVRSRTWVWATLLAFSSTLLVAYAPWTVLGPVVADDAYGRIAVYGIAATAIGAGTVLGAILAARWRPAHPMRTGILAALLWPVSIMAFVLGLPLAVMLAITVAAGAGLSLFEVWWQTALAQRIPPHLLSRVTAYDYMGSLMLMPLGYLLAGPAAEVIGAREVLFGGAVIGAVLLALALLPRETRMLGRLDPPVLPTADPDPRVPV